MTLAKFCATVSSLSTVCGSLLALGLTGVNAYSADDPRRPPAVSVQNVPTIPDSLANRLRQYQSTRQASFSGWAPDGNGLLIQTRFGNTAQLHRVYEPGGRREQVTFFDEPASGRFVPGSHGGELLISMGKGGNENYQLYVTDHDAGEAKLLTDGKSRNILGPVRHDGLFAIVASTERNSKDTDLYIADLNRPGEKELLLKTDSEFWEAADWSHDGSKLLVRKVVSINENYPGLLDVGTGKVTSIPLPVPKAAADQLQFSNDGMSAYMACDANGEFRQLCQVELATMKLKWLTADIPWDVEEIEVAPQPGAATKDVVAFTVNADGASQLYFWMGDKPMPVKTPMGVISGLEFNPSGDTLAFTLSRPNHPADVYSISLRDPQLVRWTYSETGGIAPDRFTEPSLVRFKTFDDRTIPAFYYKPSGASKDRKAGVVINIHGGPESQSRPTFDPLMQFYSNEAGLAVLVPNVRGSEGYGKTYLQLDNGPLREDSVKDIGALLDWVAQQPELDASRVAVFGGSYGGYMVLASLTNFPTRLKAGVDIVGIGSFKSFLENTSPYRRDLRRVEYGDERTAEMQQVFAKIDPVHNVLKIRSALLVAHGKNDPRVPFSEAEQIAKKVTANGQAVWTVYADNEGHGFARKENRDYITAVFSLFLMEHLK